MENSSRGKRTLPSLQPENTKKKCYGNPKEDEDDDDVAEVEMKVMALRKIVPGGELVANMDVLFEETAGYILTLQAQIKAMRLLTSLLQGLQKEDNKLGG